jgi:hypothetical protein
MIGAADEEVTPVSEQTVVEHWLCQEAAKSNDGVSPDEVAALSAQSARRRLLNHKPGAAAVFHEAPRTDWFRLRLQRSELLGLRYISEPENVSWGSLAHDRHLSEGARRIVHEDATVLRSETEVDISQILKYRKRLSRGETLSAPVLTTRRGVSPTRILDGNYRLTALGAWTLESGKFDGINVFLGVCLNPVLRPALERIVGALERVAGRRRF